MGQAVFGIPAILFTTTTVGIALGLMLRKVLKVKRHSPVGAVLPVLTGLGFFLLGCAWLRGWLEPDYGFAVTPAEANRVAFIRAIGVPEAARDVNYRVSPAFGLLVVLDFQIGENDFLRWMAKKGWTPHHFVRDQQRGIVWDDPKATLPKFAPSLSQATVTPVRSYLEGSHEEVEVREGYYFDNYDPKDDYDDSGDTVVYDSEKGRAYLERSTY